MRYPAARLASAGKSEGRTGLRSTIVYGLFGLLLAAPLAAAAQSDVFKPPPPVTYTEKFEVFTGFEFMNGMAGDHLPKTYNAGGAEGEFTYYLTPHWGVAGDYRWVGGTTPVLPAGQSYGVQTRPFVSQSIGMGGVQYRWLTSQRAALNLHALAGVTSGDFSHSTQGNPIGQAQAGLYADHSAAMGVAGGSLEFNVNHAWAVRLSPDIVFEHFGSQTREFFAISLGPVYRFGKRR